MRLRSANSLEDLTVITAVARSKNFSSAARELSLPPSSISRRIAAVENRLGVALFQRTTREVSLTDAGHAYCARIERILTDIEHADLQVSRFANMAEGTLHVETRPGLSAWLLAPLLPKFLAAYPTISVDLRLTNDTLERLSPDTDLGLRYGLAAPSSLVTRKITTTRQRTYASPVYLERYGVPNSPDDLIRHNCIGFSYGDKQVTWRYRGTNYDRRIAVRGNVRSNDVTTLRTATVDGLGITVGHVWIMENAINEGRVVEILSDYEATTMDSFDMHVSALYSPAMKNVEKVRVFIDFLLNALREGQAVPSQHLMTEPLLPALITG